MTLPVTDKLYTLSDLESLRERCAAFHDEQARRSDLQVKRYQAKGDHTNEAYWAHDRRLHENSAYSIRLIPLTPHTEEGTR